MNEKVEEIKKLLSTLSKESLLIWGQYLWDLKYRYSPVPEIPWMKNPSGWGLILVDPSQESRYNLLLEGRTKIINELWSYMGELYAQKVFGGLYDPSRKMNAWMKICIGDHISSKKIGKYTKYNGGHSFDFVLPDDKVIHTIWTEH